MHVYKTSVNTLLRDDSRIRLIKKKICLSYLTSNIGVKTFESNISTIAITCTIVIIVISGNGKKTLTFWAKSFVFEWQTVTVAWFHFRSSEAGVPTILLRPKTTASAPAILMPDLFANSITPFGVHGRNPDKSPIATRPSFIVFKLRKFALH